MRHFLLLAAAIPRPAARRGCGGPTGSSGAPRPPGAAPPVAPGGRIRRRSRSGRGRTGCRPRRAVRSGHSRSGAAPTAPSGPGGSGGLQGKQESGSLRRGGPWVVPGFLQATRSVSLTAESLLAFRPGLSRPRSRALVSPGAAPPARVASLRRFRREISPTKPSRSGSAVPPPPHFTPAPSSPLYRASQHQAAGSGRRRQQPLLPRLGSLLNQLQRRSVSELSVEPLTLDLRNFL